MGVPTLTCKCPVCLSDDPRDKRMRTSVWVRTATTSLLIDTPPEMRLQAIANDVRRLDAVLFTHSHADHVFGLDDVRRFNFLQRRAMPVYAQAATLDDLRRVFAYVFTETQAGGGKPSLDLRVVDGSFRVGDIDVVPVPVLHGSLPILGYRFGGFAYVTDVSEIAPGSMAILRGLDVLVLGALRPKPHPTHFHIARAIEVAQELAPGQTYFTHVTHDVEHEATNRDLPPGIELGYDGLTFEV